MLALTIEPDWLGWVGALAGPVSIVLICAAYFKLDARYERKVDAKETAEAERKYVDNLATERRRERAAEVSVLEKSDTELRDHIEKLAGVVDRHITHYNTAHDALRSEVTKGFVTLTSSMGDGFLMISKDVARMQGQVSGLGQTFLPPSTK